MNDHNLRNRPKGSTDWARAADAILVAEWKKGTSTRRIAELVAAATSKPCTRNAVIGRANRKGLGPHPAAASAHTEAAFRFGSSESEQMRRDRGREGSR